MSGRVDQIEAEFPSGHQIGRYALREAVGQGGMGTVYAAFDPTTNRNVAIKILAPGIPETLRLRFLAECEAQAKIRHPNVMPVYDRAWLTEERPYFTMELLYAPITLGDIVAWVRDGSLSKRHPRLRHWSDPVKLINDVIIPVARGIAVANGQYLIQHRDIKPDNILIDVRTRRPYVIDFGICRPIDEAADEHKIVGTPRFLSTEQARGQVDPRTDVWGIGALLHFTLTGEPPLRRASAFSRREVEDRIAALRTAERKAEDKGENAKLRGYRERRRQLEDPDFRTLEDLYQDARDGNYLPLPEDVSSALAAIVKKAMAGAPDARYDTVGELVEDLEAWVGGGSVQALSEADSRGAAVDLAKRTVRRNIVTVVGVAIALALGAILGRAIFKQPPLRPDYRVRDAATDVDSVLADVNRYDVDARAGRLDPMTAHAAWSALLERLDRASNHARTATPSTTGDAGRVQDSIQSVRATLARVPLEIEDRGPWFIVDVLDPDKKTVKYVSGRSALSPGLWRLERRTNPAAAIPLVVPFRKHEMPPAPIRVAVPAFPDDAPDGMIWVPADAHGNGPRTSDLLVLTRLVTCEQYGEFLDDLPSAERQAHVPPVRFEQSDPSDSTRWLAIPEFQSRAVIGLSPGSMDAYAAWRSSVHGISLRLPTDAEWQQLAGAGWIEAPGGGHLLRYGDSNDGPKTSPFGIRIRQTPEGHGEVVTSGDGSLVVKTPDARPGVIPIPSAFRHNAPVDDDEKYGFRLVSTLD